MKGGDVVSSSLLTIRMGNNYINHKGGCGPLEAKEISLTLACANSQILFVFRKKQKRQENQKGK